MNTMGRADAVLAKRGWKRDDPGTSGAGLVYRRGSESFTLTVQAIPLHVAADGAFHVRGHACHQAPRHGIVRFAGGHGEPLILGYVDRNPPTISTIAFLLWATDALFTP